MDLCVTWRGLTDSFSECVAVVVVGFLGRVPGLVMLGTSVSPTILNGFCIAG